MTTTVANTEQIANIAILLTELHAYTQKRGRFIVNTLTYRNNLKNETE